MSMPDRMNAVDFFVDSNITAGRGDKVAIVDLADGRQHTYLDVRNMVNRFGNVLRDRLGVHMEERVLLLLLDSPAFAAAFFGAIKVGMVPVPTNTLLKPADYEYLLNDSRAQVVVVSGFLFEQLAPCLESARYLKHVVVVGGCDGCAAPDRIELHDWDELNRTSSDRLESEPMSKDDACFWLYSSGTTGFPKGTVHLHHDMVVASENYARGVLDMRESDRTFSVAKLFFAYGLGNGLYFPFFVGATTILFPGRPDPEAFFSIIHEHRPTLFFSVPTAYQSMLTAPDAADRCDTTSIRACISAGEALPGPVWQRWYDRFGLEILDGIGSTEILHIFLSNRLGECRPGSTGKVVPGYELRLTDEDDRDVPAGEVGDLLVSGDSTCSHYWNQHERSKDTIVGRWIRTGDKYSQDEDGYFWYHGRSDDMLKVGGFWVSPVEVECALLEHPAVLECAVVGAADEAGLIKPKAFVVVAPGHIASEDLAEELRQFARSRIAKYKYPRWIAFLDELPKTATGKVQRYKLR
jgi:benzoate-CoA ligase family protein